MLLRVPDRSLVALVGPSGCGKTTFAHRHFAATEVLSSDRCRAAVADDEGDQSATADAFDVLHLIAAKRLARGRLTVVDATNLRPRARRALIDLAHHHHLPAVAIVFDLPEALCAARNRERPDRTVDPDVIRRHAEQLRRCRPHLGQEGFADVVVITSPAAVDAAAVARVPLPPDRREDRGPFDIIGDVHGCATELELLLGRLGYARDGGVWRHPAGRRAFFLGDLVDRGPRTADALRTAMAMVDADAALCVPGNHDDKLLRALRGRRVQARPGLQQTLADLERESPAFRAAAADFLEGLVSHYVLDGGRLVVAHAGMKEELQNRVSKRVRDFALYGETTGRLDELGLPERVDWAAGYRGAALVVYGHAPVAEPRWMNRTVNIDTGCVFGGRLTALRYPELELLAVPAARVYAAPARAPRRAAHAPRPPGVAGDPDGAPAAPPAASPAAAPAAGDAERR